MSKSSRFALVVSFGALVGSAVSATFAADGPYSLARLQPSRDFSRRGLIRSIAAGEERIDDLGFVALDSAGRVIVAGGSLTRSSTPMSDPDTAPAVARFLPDGRLDTTFGGNGIVRLPLTGFVTGLAIDRSDRVAVSGSFTDAADVAKRVVAVRLLADGSPDPSFAGDGFARFDHAAAPGLFRLRADPRDDALVGLGSGTITRLTASGALDEGFGTGGSAPVPPQSLGLAVDELGRCVVSSEQATVRVLPDGTQDPAFGTGGLLRGPLGGAMGSHTVAIDGQQRIVMRGYEDGTSRGVYRFLPTGAPDPAFGDGGVAAIPIAAPGDTEAPELALGVSHGTVDRYAFASTLHLYASNLSRQKGTFGSLVQVVDPAHPLELASRVALDPHARGRQIQTFLPDVAVSDDGTKAYAAGTTVVKQNNGQWLSQTPVLLCLDLAHPAVAPLPDFTAAWTAQPLAERSGTSLRFTGSVRVTNDGRGDAANVRVSFLVSDDAVASDDDRLLFDQPVGRLRRGQSRVLRLESPIYAGADLPTAGKFLIAVVNRDRIVPESGTANADAVSPAALE